MSTNEIKKRIAEMTPQERDDIKLYIDVLDGQENAPPLSTEQLSEIDRRIEAYDQGLMTALSSDEVITLLRDRIHSK
jgi:hypothetical protein